MIREILKTPEQFQTLQVGDLICGIEAGPERPIISPNDEPTFMGIIKDLVVFRPTGKYELASLVDDPKRFKAILKDVINTGPFVAQFDRNSYCEIVTYRLFDNCIDSYDDGPVKPTTEVCLYYEEEVTIDHKKELRPNWIPFRVLDSSENKVNNAS